MPISILAEPCCSISSSSYVQKDHKLSTSYQYCWQKSGTFRFSVSCVANPLHSLIAGILANCKNCNKKVYTSKTGRPARWSSAWARSRLWCRLLVLALSNKKTASHFEMTLILHLMKMMSTSLCYMVDRLGFGLWVYEHCRMKTSWISDVSLSWLIWLLSALNTSSVSKL